MAEDDLSVRVSKFKFTQFNSKTNPWKYYFQRYELQLDIQNIKHTDAAVAAKRNLLLHFIGPDVYWLTVDYFSPTKVTGFTYDNFVNYLNKFFKPTCNYLPERRKFGKIHRKTEQSIAQYLSELRPAAGECKFGATLNERLRDQFLLGLNNPNIQEELFRKHPEDGATHADIETDALLLEAAYQQRKNFEASNSKSASDAAGTVAKVNSKPKQKGQSKGKSAQPPIKGSSDSKLSQPVIVDALTQCTRWGKNTRKVSLARLSTATAVLAHSKVTGTLCA